MFRRWLRKAAALPALAPADVALPALSPDDIRHLLFEEEGVTHVDWQMATAWIEHRETDPAARAQLRRAIAATWLDSLAASIVWETHRWRSSVIEGLAPTEHAAGRRLEAWSGRAVRSIAEAFTKIRASAPIPPVIVLCTRSREAYYSFISRFYDEGEHATSAGIYLRSDGDSVAMLVISGVFAGHHENTLAHELAHHLLDGCRLPVWAEEGLTQMMEERVAGSAHFALDHAVLHRHRALWEEIGFEGFESGATFHSPRGEEQELSYHLALFLTRSLLATRAEDFFAFARACRHTDPELACREHLEAPVGELAAGLIW